MSPEFSWPEHFSGFKQIETLLKCGICYEFMKTALITPCSHNYCSYCIRKSLLYKLQCPTCFEETNEPQLRNNRVIDELIAVYTSFRGSLIKHLISTTDVFVQNGLCSTPKSGTAQNSAVKRNLLKADFPGVSTMNEDLINRVEQSRPSGSIDDFSCQRYSASTAEAPVVICSDSDSDEPVKPVPARGEQRIPSMFSPKKQNNGPTVSCPVCTVNIPEQNINIHLDACLQRAEQQSDDRIPRKESRKPLPKLVYSLLQDKDLKKKLKAHGLSILGDRRALVNRHQRFTLLYNSECDAIKPKSVSEIIQQLEREELEEKKAATAPLRITKLNVDRKADPQVIEEAQQQYLQDHKSSFQGLIQSIKNRQVKKDNITESHQSEVEDDPEITIIQLLSPEDGVCQKTVKKSFRFNRIVSDSEDDTTVGVDDAVMSDLTVHDATSPVLGRRNQSFTSLRASGENRAVLRQGSVTPDMFEIGTPVLPESSSSIPAGQDTNKAAEDSDEDSNTSISLMVYHTQGTNLDFEQYAAGQIAEQSEGKMSETLIDVDIQQHSSVTTEHSNIQEENDGKLQTEGNSKAKPRDLNFELGIDALLSDSEDEVLPERKSKRKTVIPSPNAEDPTARRVLRKRVKR